MLALAACGEVAGGPSTSGPVGSSVPALSAGESAGAEPAMGRPAVKEYTVEVLRAFPHDPTAYTQGLEWHDGALLESTGQYGKSRLRRVDLETGEIRREVVVDPDLFAEGVTRVGERLIQLTWQAGLALVYDAGNFEALEPLRYRGEGWGLCFDGERLVMSDGSDLLSFRDPATFDLLGTVAVTLHGAPVGNLNELECVEGEVYANVYGREILVAIDPASGRVRRVIDAAGLLSASERAHAEVLNGIAHRPGSDRFFLTGKHWPKLFEVRFVER